MNGQTLSTYANGTLDRSTTKKTGPLLQFFLKHNLKILFISETQCNEAQISRLKLNGYNISSYSTRQQHKHPRLKFQKGGGTCILLDKSLKYQSFKQSYFDKFDIGPIELSVTRVFTPISSKQHEQTLNLARETIFKKYLDNENTQCSTVHSSTNNQFPNTTYYNNPNYTNTPQTPNTHSSNDNKHPKTP
jgi:hypothetical protein